MSTKLNGFKRFPTTQLIDASYSADQRTEAHVDRHSRISIVLQGQLKEAACRKETYAAAGSIVFKPGDLVHQNAYGPNGTRIVSIIFKQEAMQQWAGMEINDWQWLHGFPTASFAFQLAKSLPMISTEEDLQEALIPLFAQIQTTPDFSTTSKEAPPWLHRIAEKIQEEYDQLIRTKDLAKAAGVHPVYLARVFRQHYGCSIKSYLKKIRIERALQDLSKGKKSVAQIALDHGFADQSHLTRIFSQGIEMSPGAFRKWLLDYSLVLSINKNG